MLRLSKVDINTSYGGGNENNGGGSGRGGIDDDRDKTAAGSQEITTQHNTPEGVWLFTITPPPLHTSRWNY